MLKNVHAISFQDGCRSHHAATIGNGSPKMRGRTTQHCQAFRVSIFNKVRARAKMVGRRTLPFGSKNPVLQQSRDVPVCAEQGLAGRQFKSAPAFHWY
jgi:hypothetical protein